LPQHHPPHAGQRVLFIGDLGRDFRPSALNNGGATTMAVGEEGGGEVTTMALGEEGSTAMEVGRGPTPLERALELFVHDFVR